MDASESSFVTESRRGPVAYAERDADRTHVWIRGEHDLSTVSELSKTLARAIALDDADLVVDLSEVDFMDASGVGVFVRTRAFLEARSRSLSVQSPSPAVRRLFDACGLADLIDPHPGDASPLTGTGSALGTWVAVPAAERGERTSTSSLPERSPYPVRSGRFVATTRTSSPASDEPPTEEPAAQGTRPGRQ